MTDREVGSEDPTDEGSSPGDGDRNGGRLRRWLTVVLVVLTSFSMAVSVVAVWAHGTVFDTEQFMETVGPVLDEPVFYDALSERVADEVVDVLELERRIAERLAALDEFLSVALIDALDPGDAARRLLGRFDRPTLDSLSPAIAASIEGIVRDAIDTVFTSDEFRAAFPVLVEELHRAALALATGDPADFENAYVEDGEVRLNLIPVIASALRLVADEIRDFLPDIELPEVVSSQVDEGIEQISAALAVQLPDDFGQVTIMSEDDLTAIRDAATGINRLVWAIVILTVVLIGATVFISATRRRTIVQLGIGVAIGVLGGWLIISRIRDSIIEGLQEERVVAVAGLIDQLVNSLGLIQWIVGGAAVLVAVTAYLIGRPAWLQRSEHWVEEQRSADHPTRSQRWIATHYDALRLVGAAVALAVLIILGLGVVQVIIIGILLAAYLWALSAMRRRAVDDAGNLITPVGAGVSGDED